MLDTVLHPIDANAYRFWRISGDSMIPTYQVQSSNGFVLPQDGMWVVEAWDADTTEIGSLAGLPRQLKPTDSCVGTVGRSIEQNGVIGIITCADLMDTTRHSRRLSMVRTSTPRPVAVGMFVVTDTVHRFKKTPKGEASWRFLIWKVDWDSVKLTNSGETTAKKDSVRLTLKFVQLSGQTGVADVTLPSGDWLLEGWSAKFNAAGVESYDSWKTNWGTPVKFADSSMLRKCFSDTGACARVYPDIAGIPSASIIFTYRSP